MGFSRIEKPISKTIFPKNRQTGSVKNPRAFFLVEFTFNQAPCHLDTHAQHRLGDFDVLTLKERLGIFGETQSNQGTLVLSPAQLDAAIRKFDNF